MKGLKMYYENMVMKILAGGGNEKDILRETLKNNTKRKQDEGESYEQVGKEYVR